MLDCFYPYFSSSTLLSNRSPTRSHAAQILHAISQGQVKEVPYYRRPWNRKYLRYNPKHWNETCRFDECDPDITSPVFQPKFNTIDGNVNRKRVKACGENLTYEVVDGFPLNSAGRTGLTGRGILPHYGPNHMMGVIFVW
ncbi:hypothetical protein D918_01212 [Trichuris suis]|nr:hypothetical protein D918_01212 [Trichuris suis]